jgi:hypothetical protein
VSTRRPAPRRSVFAQGEVEALEYKWILSERAGHDVGDWGIRLWVREHWHGFLRDRWLEHLRGRTFWIELDHDDFGLLEREFENSALIDEIVWRLKTGWENLDVICWALDEGLPMDEVVNILEMLDINSRRIECQFAQSLSHAG